MHDADDFGIQAARTHPRLSWNVCSVSYAAFYAWGPNKWRPFGMLCSEIATTLRGQWLQGGFERRRLQATRVYSRDVSHSFWRIFACFYVKLTAARRANPKRRQRIPTCVSACVRGVGLACVVPESACCPHRMLYSLRHGHTGAFRVPDSEFPSRPIATGVYTCVPRCTRGGKQSEQTERFNLSSLSTRGAPQPPPPKHAKI
jgi:hypothetical protein